MSQNTKLALGVVILVVIVGGVWWFAASRMASPTADLGAPNNSATGNQMAVNNQPTQTSANDGVSATDSSNAALNTDLSNIDAQMNGFSSDNANMNSGLNDQQVQQSQLQ